MLPTINEALKQLTPLPVLIQNHPGGDSVTLGIFPPSPIFWDLGPHHYYLSRDNLALSQSNK